MNYDLAKRIVTERFGALSGSVWRELAACRPGNGVDPKIFFPQVFEKSYVAAQRVCKRCEVRPDCLLFAIARQENIPGVWGGLTPNERKALRSRRACDDCGTSLAGYPSRARFCKDCRKAGTEGAWRVAQH